MATTDDLRALPEWADGWPTEEGWYVYERHPGATQVAEFTRSTDVPSRIIIGGMFSDMSPALILRHAPLRLETGAMVQALTALHLAGFEGGILDAVGASLKALDDARSDAKASDGAALRGRVAELEARRPGRCPACYGRGNSAGCDVCGGSGATMVGT